MTICFKNDDDGYDNCSDGFDADVNDELGFDDGFGDGD